MPLAARWLVMLLAFSSSLVFGHDTMASWAIARMRGDTFELKIKMAAESAWPLVQQSVAPGAVFVREEFDTVGKPMLFTFARTLEEVTINGQALAPVSVDVAVLEDYFEFTLVYPLPASGRLRLRELYLANMPSGYASHIAVLGAHAMHLGSKILNAGDSSYEMKLPMGRATDVATASAPSFQGFLKLGVEHILGGYDHLLFLCGLLVVCRRISSMLAIITCFTVAHSLTLALAALDLVTLPSRIVEPLIAASIVFVGIENLVRRDEPSGRWALTFAFGLIHGFGFASVLREMGLGAGGASIALPLFSFNLGVEMGQVAATLVLLPLLWGLRRFPTFAHRALPAISACVALVGTYWFMMRTVF